MDTVEISIIMPVYNSERYLRQALNSIFMQTYQDFNLVLIDDGSTDRSGMICDQYAAIDSRVTVIHTENEGISRARNKGLAIADGQYIYFMDNDDTLNSHAFEILHRIIQQASPELILFGSRLYTVENDITMAVRERKLPEFNCCSRQQIGGKLPELLGSDMLNCVWDKLYQRELLRKKHIDFNPVFTNGGEDFDFNLRLYPYLKNMINLEDILYHYYLRDTQSTYRKFNPRTYEHALHNLRRAAGTAHKLGVNIHGFLYQKYIEYKLRLIIMLCHKDNRKDQKENCNYCKAQFERDGFSNKFKRRALRYFLIMRGISIRKKLLMVIVHIKLYRLAFCLTRQYVKSR